ncbi:MAG: hypothetical protein ACR2MN_08875 [Acidimicrobiales bacterium]
MKPTFSGGSCHREGISTGRNPICMDSSAVRAALLADRTDANVATANTKVPPAVAREEIVTQSVTVASGGNAA